MKAHHAVPIATPGRGGLVRAERRDPAPLTAISVVAATSRALLVFAVTIGPPSCVDPGLDPKRHRRLRIPIVSPSRRRRPSCRVGHFRPGPSICTAKHPTRSASGRVDRQGSADAWADIPLVALTLVGIVWRDGSDSATATDSATRCCAKRLRIPVPPRCDVDLRRSEFGPYWKPRPGLGTSRPPRRGRGLFPGDDPWSPRTRRGAPTLLQFADGVRSCE